MLKTIINKIHILRIKCFKPKWAPNKILHSSIGVCIILIIFSIIGATFNVKYLSTDPSFQNTVYNIFNSLLIGIISSSIITLTVELNNARQLKQKRLSVLFQLNYELCLFQSRYKLYKKATKDFPNGHPLLEENAHYCDKYVFLYQIVNECANTLSVSKDYLSPKEYDTLYCIITNYHCMESVIGADLLSMFNFHPVCQYQLEDTTYDELLDTVGKAAIPELFNDIIKGLKKLKTELELDGFHDI